MQYQRYHVAGPPHAMQFYPCMTPPQWPQNEPEYPRYSGPCQGVVGEGDVSSIVLPDGSVQLFFIPATPSPGGRCYPQSPPYWNTDITWNNAANLNRNGAWFVRSVNNPAAVQETCRLLAPQLHGGPRCCNRNDCHCSSFALPPNLVKFHNDKCTSTTDIGYFCPPYAQSYCTPLPPVHSPVSAQVSSGRPCIAEVECQTPRVCTEENPDLEVYLDCGVGPDTADKKGRTKKRKRRNYCGCETDCSISSYSCERNKKRRKIEKYDSDCSLCCEELRRQRKHREKLRKNLEKERKKRDREREKEAIKKEKHRRSKERGKHHGVYINSNEQMDLDHVDRVNNKCITIWDRPSCTRDLGTMKTDSQNDTHINTDYTSFTPGCLVCKLGSAVGSVMSYLTSSSSSTNASNTAWCSRVSSATECTKLSNKECRKVCNKECPSNKDLDKMVKPIESGKGIGQKPIANQKWFEKELKIHEAERNKSEKEFQKMMKAEQKKSDKELKIRQAERKKSEKELQKIMKAEQKKSDKELKILKAERKKSEKELQKRLKGDIKRTKKESKLRFAENKKSEKELQKMLKAEHKISVKDLNRRDTELKNLVNNFLKKEKVQQNRPLRISDNPCRDFDCQENRCGNYCKIAREIEKFNNMEQASSAIINYEKDSQKSCGVWCEPPIQADKQMATCTDQSNSGVFADIMQKLGIGIQCSSRPREPPRPLCDVVRSEPSLNCLFCPRRDPSCNPL